MYMYEAKFIAFHSQCFSSLLLLNSKFQLEYWFEWKVISLLCMLSRCTSQYFLFDSSFYWFFFCIYNNKCIDVSIQSTNCFHFIQFLLISILNADLHSIRMTFSLDIHISWFICSQSFPQSHIRECVVFYQLLQRFFLLS